MTEGLIKLADEIYKIDSDIKEQLAAAKIVEKAEHSGFLVSKIEGFHEKLRIKMDSAVQRQSEKLDEKAVELAELTRIFLLKNCEAAPTAENVEAETKIVADFCAELKAFLESDRSADCPKMPLAVEESIERLLNNPPKVV
ncbi:unnamed protein product [Caenorhabditis brenneri]